MEPTDCSQEFTPAKASAVVPWFVFDLHHRFQQWAFGEGGMREIWANLPAQGQSLFPLLRSTSDLLMMPKDLLLEEGIRTDLCDSVSLHLLVSIVELFANSHRVSNTFVASLGAARFNCCC